jgi:hypothetical protein
MPVIGLHIFILIEDYRDGIRKYVICTTSFRKFRIHYYWLTYLITISINEYELFIFHVTIFGTKYLTPFLCELIFVIVY